MKGLSTGRHPLFHVHFRERAAVAIVVLSLFGGKATRTSGVVGVLSDEVFEVSRGTTGLHKGSIVCCLV
jgi:hypothetical protein